MIFWRLLGARIVAGQDQVVGVLRGGFSHTRPLGTVAVAAGAEHRDQLAFRDFAQDFKHVFKCVVGVRVVDVKDRPLRGGAEGFEPPRHPDRAIERMADRLRLESVIERRENRSGQVVDVMRADQVGGDVERLLLAGQAEFRAFRAEFDVGDHPVRRRGHAESDLLAAPRCPAPAVCRIRRRC